MENHELFSSRQHYESNEHVYIQFAVVTWAKSNYGIFAHTSRLLASVAGFLHLQGISLSSQTFSSRHAYHVVWKSTTQ